jgi:hypothetical protein
MNSRFKYFINPDRANCYKSVKKNQEEHKELKETIEKRKRVNEALRGALKNTSGKKLDFYS